MQRRTFFANVLGQQHIQIKETHLLYLDVKLFRLSYDGRQTFEIRAVKRIRMKMV